MESSQLQSNRYEFKYIIDESMAGDVRAFVLQYLEPDGHTKRPGVGYAVHSLYLDTPGLDLCRATLDGLKNRFKLRIRFYDDHPDSPIFFEIKRRVNLVILKERAAVRRAAVPRLIAGGWPELGDLFNNRERFSPALENFCWLRDEIDARPVAYASYLREGYEPKESNVCRVTFDRCLRAGVYCGRLSIEDLESWAKPDVPGVVLELKFTDRFPEWMHELVESFDLCRTTMPKYVKCVSLVRGFRSLSNVQVFRLTGRDDALTAAAVLCR